ncbi:MAG: DUF3558 family protein [Rhodococcus sp. (in: high G+C Gram-positive bacteria)]
MPVAELWDPCTIPSDALVGAGVDPEVIGSGQYGSSDNEWKYCTFHQDWFLLSVLSTTNSLEKVREDPRNEQLSDARVGNRDAIVYLESTSSFQPSCFVSLAVEQGAVAVRISVAANARTSGDQCAEATRLADDLIEHLPN